MKNLMLATLHTNNTPTAVTRLTDMGVEPFLTASAVDCVIAQRLARRLCPHCKRPVEVDRRVLSDLGFPFDHWPGGDLAFHEPVGCERCGGAGWCVADGAAQASANAVVDTETAAPTLQMLAFSWIILLTFGGASVGCRLRETFAGRPNSLYGVGAEKARR